MDCLTDTHLYSHAPDSIFIRTLEENEMQGKLIV